jgi:hypothetical protein
MPRQCETWGGGLIRPRLQGCAKMASRFDRRAGAPHLDSCQTARGPNSKVEPNYPRYFARRRRLERPSSSSQFHRDRQPGICSRSLFVVLFEDSASAALVAWSASWPRRRVHGLTRVRSLAPFEINPVVDASVEILAWPPKSLCGKLMQARWMQRWS